MSDIAPRGSVDAPVRSVGRGGPAWTGLLSSNEVGLAILIGLFVVGFVTAAPGFASPFNLYALSRVFAIDAMIGLSMMVVIATGGLNLAVGAIGVASAMVAGWFMQVHGLPVSISLLAGLGAGAALGAMNGVLSVRLGVHSFIVTLATMSIYFGAMVVLTEAEAFNALPKTFTDLGKARVFGVVSQMVFLTAGVAALLWVLFRFTRFGRMVLAAGANERASMLSGLPTGAVITGCHALSGLLAALAGLMLSARNGAALPSMAGHVGVAWLLPAFLAPVLGGTLLTGGRVSVIGTVLGALLVTVMSSGLLLLQIGEFWVQATLGAVLLLAVLLDSLRARLGERGA